MARWTRVLRGVAGPGIAGEQRADDTRFAADVSKRVPDGRELGCPGGQGGFDVFGKATVGAE
jgi:hypothetical protein